MTRLIIFNKRRRAEVKDMKVKDYVERPQWHSRENGEIRMAMSKTDALFANRFELYITCILFSFVSNTDRCYICRRNLLCKLEIRDMGAHMGLYSL